MDGGAVAAIYAEYDNPEIMEEWASLEHADVVRQMSLILDAKPDCVLLGASGTLTLSNPSLVQKYCLPSIKVLTNMAQQAGIPTMLHSCGKSAAFLEMLYNETDLNCINPLEASPMGDVTLLECKQKYGNKFCLMGNLNTTDIMLKGSTKDVQRAAQQAIDDAGSNGGFILSTGDQCGRDTPEENIFKLVEVADTYGRYERRV
jgi:uroporphyrinogen decarboxylase